MHREFSRSDRLASQIQRELADLLQRTTKDPRFKLVTINAVKVSRDLSVANVYIGSLNYGDDSVDDGLSALSKAASFLRRELASRVRIRNIPELRFMYDHSVDRARRISAILESIRKPEFDRNP